MADVETDFELGETLLILFVIAVGIYFLYQAWKKVFGGSCCQYSKTGVGTSILGKIKSGLDDIGATVTGPADFVGKGKLTAGQARSVALTIKGTTTDYSISPDGTQVWFYDGSFYDNTTGHYTDKSGSDLGAAFCGCVPVSAQGFPACCGGGQGGGCCGPCGVMSTC